MKRFSFSLQKVLDFREFEKKQAEAELAKAAGEESRIQRGLMEIAENRAKTVLEADSMRSIYDLGAVQNYFCYLDKKKDELSEELAKAKIIADEKREIMREAMRKCKMLENLKDSRIAAWKKEQLKIEEDAIDDIVTSRFGLKM